MERLDQVECDSIVAVHDSSINFGYRGASKVRRSGRSDHPRFSQNFRGHCKSSYRRLATEALMRAGLRCEARLSPEALETKGPVGTFRPSVRRH